MTERTLTGKKRPPIRRPYGRSTPTRTRARVAVAPTPGERFRANAGKGSLAALPWALALLGASAVLAATTVIGR